MNQSAKFVLVQLGYITTLMGEKQDISTKSHHFLISLYKIGDDSIPLNETFSFMISVCTVNLYSWTTSLLRLKSCRVQLVVVNGNLLHVLQLINAI